MATKDISVIRDKETGDIKNIRDKGLMDAKPKTAVAQTDAVRMKTVDGKEVYIERNSLVQALAEVLNSNSQSTITTLFGADSNGNHANINMSNLASVLSASPGVVAEGSINNITTPGKYVVTNAINSAPWDGIMFVINSSYWLMQIVIGVGNGGLIYKRSWATWESEWGSWKTIS